MSVSSLSTGPGHGDRLLKIGEISASTGLSLRTIRYYEEVGLVEPDERSEGGFRLYSETALVRFELIASLRPLDLSLDDLRDLICSLANVTSGSDTGHDNLVRYAKLADERAHYLLQQADQARSVSRQLRSALAKAQRVGHQR